jgi:glutamate carboxypeptidase
MSLTHRYAEYLQWVDAQAAVMVDRVAKWASVNSWSRNLAGLEGLGALLAEDFAPLGGEAREVHPTPRRTVDSAGQVIEEPMGRPLCLRKRAEARFRVLLVGHMDTVFSPRHPFQWVERTSDAVIKGPGVLDAKGGLAVMLTALEALERSPWAPEVGWEVFINADEELGSPGSGPSLVEAARRNHVGLVFEPGYPDGSLVGTRKGSGSFSVVVRGKAAHAGRNPEEGRNAVHALADFIVALKTDDTKEEGILLNVGVVEGGEAVNVVPDLAIGRFNVRVSSIADQQEFEHHLDRVLAGVNGLDGISVELHGGFARPPKTVDARTQGLLESLVGCERSLGSEKLTWRATGGASDGNNLAGAGLPTADGLGPWGGGIHTDEEFLVVDSLTQRARLVALFLMRLGTGEIRLTER